MLPGDRSKPLVSAASLSSSQDTSVCHRRPARLAPTRRVTDSADISHSSHYGTKVTRRVLSDVSLNCDGGIYVASRGPCASLRVRLVATISDLRCFDAFLVVWGIQTQYRGPSEVDGCLRRLGFLTSYSLGEFNVTPGHLIGRIGCSLALRDPRWPHPAALRICPGVDSASLIPVRRPVAATRRWPPRRHPDQRHR
jgi:hypothetical protein